MIHGCEYAGISIHCGGGVWGGGGGGGADAPFIEQHRTPPRPKKPLSGLRQCYDSNSTRIATSSVKANQEAEFQLLSWKFSS